MVKSAEEAEHRRRLLGVRDRNDDLMKISRRGSVHAVENQYTEFVLDALRDLTCVRVCVVVCGTVAV